MNTRIENITPRLSLLHSSCDSSTETMVQFDGGDVMGVIKSYYDPDSKPFFFELSPSGWRYAISKADFVARFETLKTA